MIKLLVLVLKGMAYGLTHIVPGLGGALVMILLGIYGQFVDAVGNILIRRDKWKEYLAFLIPLGIGMVIGMVGLARLIDVLVERWPAPTQFFFMGLVLGTVPTVFAMVKGHKPTVWRVLALIAALGLVLAVRLVKVPADAVGAAADFDTPVGIAYNLLASFLGGAASVTPGLDGSYVLLLMRTYNAAIEAVGDLVHLRINWGFLVSLAVGAVGGIVLFSKLVDTALRRAPGVASYAILGLVVGALYGLWPDSLGGVNVAACVLAFAAGAVAAWLLGRATPQEPSATSDEAGAPTA